MEIKFGKVRGEEYGCFSNFYPCKIEYDGISYKNSEAAWQAQKTLDLSKRVEFSSLSGTQAKKNGRSVLLREDWENVKYELMVDILKAKFSQNKNIKQILLSTGDATLIENTTGWHDNTWGDCRCPKCKNIKGKNLLGKALMETRKELSE